MSIYYNLVAGNPAEGENSFITAAGEFSIASPMHVEEALQAATVAFPSYSQYSLQKRIEFLRAITEHLTKAKADILLAYQQESSLPEGRAEGEFGRTIAQIKTFVDLLQHGEYLHASIERPNEGATLRKMLHPIGPVAVFGASNFPLAFSTAGGDTISALAAGCPVIVKAHPYHPLTSVLVANAIQAAVNENSLPKGVFSHLQSDQYELGQALVTHPLLKGVGFTGSFKGGKALYDLAQKREHPIPVFAEMGSVNPIFIFPSALEQATLAEQLGDSISLGGGQFCTNPGVLVAINTTENLDKFEASLSAYLMAKDAQHMVHQKILSQFETKLNALKSSLNVYEGKQAALAVCNAAAFIENETLKEEVFGPYSLLVRCTNPHEAIQVLEALDGQLTITFLGKKNDQADIKSFLPLAQQKAGRILFEGVPTGVAVTQTMTHGGPFPASTDERFTAVGTDAIYRWLRPVSYQDCPNELLPTALQDENPWGIPQKINAN